MSLLTHHCLLMVIPSITYQVHMPSSHVLWVWSQLCSASLPCLSIPEPYQNLFYKISCCLLGLALPPHLSVGLGPWSPLSVRVLLRHFSALKILDTCPVWVLRSVRSCGLCAFAETPPPPGGHGGLTGSPPLSLICQTSLSCAASFSADSYCFIHITCFFRGLRREGKSTPYSALSAGRSLLS